MNARASQATRLNGFMTGSANVHSLEAITTAKAALVSFADEVDQALAIADVELRRVLDWLQHDRPRHWRTQNRLAADGVTQAKAALERCLMYPVGNERPSCREERAALQRAEARLAYCEEKSERIKHWTREVQHELFEFEGRISQLARVVEVDVPEAIDVLNRIMERLAEYQAVRVRDGGPAYDAAALAKQLWPEEPDVDQQQVKAANSDEEGIEP